MAMTVDQLANERRRGRGAGAVAIGAAVLLLGSWVSSLVVNKDAPTGDRGLLRHFDDHAAVLIATSTAKAVGVLLLLVVVLYLFRATRARNEGLGQASLVLGVAGPVLYAAGAITSAVALAVIASDFVSSAPQTADEADDALNDPSLLVIGAFASAGALALGFWFVMASLNAMRIGLLTRTMGVIGVLLGPMLVLLPSRLTDPVLSFWLAALGLLLLGYWPRGVPPAWEKGEAVPWPSPRDALAEQANGSRNGDVEATGRGVQEPELKAPGPGGGRPKRKRKRRG